MSKTPIFIKKTPWFYFIFKLIFPGINRDTIITLGHKIYCRNDLREDLLVHERVHCQQQGKYGIPIFLFLYIFSKPFRFEMELEAYQRQYKFILDTPGFPPRGDVLNAVAENLAHELSGPMYGNLISFESAVNLILGVQEVWPRTFFKFYKSRQ